MARTERTSPGIVNETIEYDHEGNAYYIFDLPNPTYSVLPVSTGGNKAFRHIVEGINEAFYMGDLKDPGKYVIRVDNNGTLFRRPTWEIRTVI